MSTIAVQSLLASSLVTVRDVRCDGACAHRSAEECATATELVFPYRGVYVRHVGRDQAIGEANQVLFFNADEGYRISHPVTGGDACLSLAIDESVLREIVSPDLGRRGLRFTFSRTQQRIDAQAQRQVALLAHGLHRRRIEPLEAESLALALVARVVDAHAAPTRAPSSGRRRLADRVKVLVAGDLARRWTLADIAADVGGSPVYLTQVFQQVEGMPLYRYQRQLRLAEALQRLPGCDDLTALALDLGFSSHSHFSAAFRETYDESPSVFRRRTARTTIVA